MSRHFRSDYIVCLRNFFCLFLLLKVQFELQLDFLSFEIETFEPFFYLWKKLDYAFFFFTTTWMKSRDEGMVRKNFGVLQEYRMYSSKIEYMEQFCQRWQISIVIVYCRRCYYVSNKQNRHGQTIPNELGRQGGSRWCQLFY